MTATDSGMPEPLAKMAVGLVQKALATFGPREPMRERTKPRKPSKNRLGEDWETGSSELLAGGKRASVVPHPRMSGHIL